MYTYKYICIYIPATQDTQSTFPDPHDRAVQVLCSFPSHICTSIDISIYLHVYLYIFTNIYIYMYMYMYICICICIYVYTYLPHRAHNRLAQTHMASPNKIFTHLHQRANSPLTHVMAPQKSHYNTSHHWHGLTSRGWKCSAVRCSVLQCVARHGPAKIPL